jgi:hypothetical protein
VLTQKKNILVKFQSDCKACEKTGWSFYERIGSAGNCKFAQNLCKAGSNRLRAINQAITTAQKNIDAQVLIVLAEETRNDVFNKEQEILQQTFETDKTEQQVAQEKAKAEQELARLQQELAKASAANRMARKGDLESARVLLGVAEAEGSWKKPVIISGIIVGALTLGFGVYKMVK